MITHTSDEPGFPSPEIWDRMVLGSPGGHLLQSWAWGEFKSLFGWRPIRVGVENGGSLVAGAQILIRRLPYRSLAYIPKGPCLGAVDQGLSQVLLEAVHQAACQQGAIALKVEPEWEETIGDDWLTGHGFRPSAYTIQPRRTIIVDLREDEETILARMKPKTRYNIRLAARKGVVVYPGTETDLELFYELMRVTGERDRFAIHSQAYYRAAWELLASRGNGVLLLAKYEQEVIGAIMVFAFGSRAYYFYGASSGRHRNRMPNHRLQWEAMRWARARGCDSYDLWGIPDLDPSSPTAALTGVQRFKQGFGGRVVRYIGAYDRVYCSPLYKLMNWAWTGRRRLLA